MVKWERMLRFFNGSSKLFLFSRSLNTLPGENPDQYVALWYQAGEPVMGRVWNENGKIAANFSWHGNEYKTNIGSIQVRTLGTNADWMISMHEWAGPKCESNAFFTDSLRAARTHPRFRLFVDSLPRCQLNSTQLYLKTSYETKSSETILQLNSRNSIDNCLTVWIIAFIF